MINANEVPGEEIRTTRHLLSSLPNWDAKIPCEYVHKPDPNNAYISSITRAGTNTFLVTAASPDSDPLTYIEIMRQAGIATSHIGFGVVIGTRFVMSDIRFSISNLSILANSHPLLVTISAIRPVYKDGQLRYARFVVKMTRNGDDFAHGSGFLACTPENIFARAEKRLEQSVIGHISEYPKLAPEIVEKQDSSEVVLAGTDHGRDTGQWRIIPGPAAMNRFHLTGMSQLEVFRQCGHALIGSDWQLIEIEATFMKMVHPRAELFCRGEVISARSGSNARAHAHTREIRVELTDQDRIVFAYGSAKFTK